ncbi:hypothetical protein [Saccharopolyspora spinosa]|uniref:Excreted virulence factor EspC (Type VII ESX diderm) n=1 Tax=Saccharopolyspora spinosa TaxID=60894 RepID=A0A2N3Y6Y0_SACSN|nr:hypothetical protein [Saccharopolyspora spinosa]PKW18702.1 hypothetical protein A8926_6824 [Saccharopolyspora spinosa]
MDGKGFHVEIDVLEAAAQRMHEIVEDQDNQELKDLAGGAELYGHGAVHAGMSEFCGKWSVGLDALGDRCRSMGGKLIKAAQTYREIDEQAARHVEDPAVDAVDPPNFEPRGHP